MASEKFAIGTFQAAGEQPFPGLVLGRAVVDLRAHLDQRITTGALFNDWDESVDTLRALAASSPDPTYAFDDLRPLPPVSPTSQIFLAGANYYRHLEQMVISMGRDADASRSEAELAETADVVVQERVESGMPFVFSVQPSALCGAHDDIVLWGPGEQHDWELELAVVIGRHCWHVSQADALDHVAGYTIGNDISTRDVMNRPNFAMTDFLMTKGRPTFKPIGPYVVPREFVPDYTSLRIELAVNGEVMQNEGVDDIIYGVEALVAYASTVTELWPGDLLLTGSPAGNAGHYGGRWLKPGDVMVGSISGLGEHRSRCVAPPGAPEAPSPTGATRDS
jgi:2,4-didehydro-3-deoxy-L-rhamnonate hydrolase